MEKLDLKSKMIEEILVLVEKNGSYAEFFMDNRFFIGKSMGRIRSLGKYGIRTSITWIREDDVTFVSYHDLDASGLMYLMNLIGVKV